MLPEQGHLLRIFIGEQDRFEGQPLYEWIIRAAQKAGLKGATVLRGITGYGAHSSIHTTKVLVLSANMPVVIEIVDELDKIENFLPTLDATITEGLVTVEKVHIRLYRTKQR